MKRKIIFIAIIVVIVIAILLFAHYAPVWVSITNLVALAVGVVLGWIANIVCNKFVKGKTEEWYERH